MNEEKKTYSIIGQVTIGTDEYRDLIEAVQEAKADTDKQRSNWYEQYNKANKLEADIKKISAVSDSYADFINSSEEIKAKYKLYLAEQQMAAMGSRED